MPAMPPGEFQLLAVAGEVAGESSLLRLRFVLASGAGGAPIGSRPAGCFLRCERCLSSMFTRPSLVNGFGRTSFMPGVCEWMSTWSRVRRLTVLEVHGDVVAADVRGHGDDRGVVKLPDEVSRRHTIQVRHDNVHENEIVFRSGVDLVHSFQPVQLQFVSMMSRRLPNCKSTYRAIDCAMERI